MNVRSLDLVGKPKEQEPKIFESSNFIELSKKKISSVLFFLKQIFKKKVLKNHKNLMRFFMRKT